jgi:hypothetical protein
MFARTMDHTLLDEASQSVPFWFFSGKEHMLYESQLRDDYVLLCTEVKPFERLWLGRIASFRVFPPTQLWLAVYTAS